MLKTSISPLDKLAWISGHWRAEALGGMAEEIWSPVLGSSLMGSFRLVVADQVKFYEFMTITEQAAEVVLRIKHFHPDLTGWEAQNNCVEAKLLDSDLNTAVFDGFVFKRVGQDQLKVSVATNQGGAEKYLLFDYVRQT